MGLFYIREAGFSGAVRRTVNGDREQQPASAPTPKGVGIFSLFRRDIVTDSCYNAIYNVEANSGRENFMKNLSAKWQKLIIWLTAYLNVIAFVLAGGYIYLNTEDEDVKDSAKNALAVVAVFTALDILRTVIYNVLYIDGSSALDFLSDAVVVITIIKAIAFVTLFVLDLKNIKIIKIILLLSKLIMTYQVRFLELHLTKKYC